MLRLDIIELPDVFKHEGSHWLFDRFTLSSMSTEFAPPRSEDEEEKCREHKSSTCWPGLWLYSTEDRLLLTTVPCSRSPGRACTGPMCLPVSSLVSQLSTGSGSSLLCPTTSRSQGPVFSPGPGRTEPDFWETGPGPERRERDGDLVRLLTDTLLPSTDKALTTCKWV